MVIGPAATATISTSGTKGVDAEWVLENRGTILWTSGSLNLNVGASGGSGRIENAAGALFEIQTDSVINASAFADRNSPPPRFDNAGVVRKTTTSGIASISVPFHNTGAVEVQSGTLRLTDGGSHSGTAIVDTGATLAPQTLTFSSGAVCLGEGQYLFDGGGIATFEADVTIPHASLAGSASFTGPGTVTIAGTLSWTGGTMSGSGRMVIGPAATATISTSGTKGVDAEWVLENRGTILWTSGSLNLNVGASGGSGRIENAAGALFEIQSDSVINASAFADRNSPPPRFDNAGTLRKTITSGLASISVPFHNVGAVEVQSGTLSLQEAATHSGSFTVSTGAILRLEGGIHALSSGSAWGGPGTVRFASPLVLEATLNFGGLNVVFEGSATVSGEFLLSNAPGGTITINRTMTVPGSLTVGGALTIGSAGYTVTVSGTLTLEATGVINNPGILRVGAFLNQGGTINGNSPVLISGGAPAIQQFRIIESDAGGLARASVAKTSRELELLWLAGPGQQFIIESSVDLIRWTEPSARPIESPSGVYRARLTAPDEPARFFRLRRID
jgi:hypothetical protein